MTAAFTRDAAAASAILAFFSLSWFGWSLENPPPFLRTVATVLMGVAVLVALAGGLLAFQHWSDGTAFDRPTSKSFGVVVGIEFTIAAIGALVLALVVRRPEFVPVWIALVVGVHFFPLGPLLHDRLFTTVAALVTLVALAAIPLARAGDFPVSAVTGLGTGLILLGAAVYSLATVVL